MRIKKWGMLIVGSVCAGLLISAIVLYPKFEQPIYEQLKAWKVVPLPEPLTELYFEDHLTLPSKVSSKDPLIFRFTIHNVEYKDMSYMYVVNLENEEVKELKRGVVNLAHEAYETVPVELANVGIATRSAIVVNLTDQDQRIHFWVEPR